MSQNRLHPSASTLHSSVRDIHASLKSRTTVYVLSRLGTRRRKRRGCWRNWNEAMPVLAVSGRQRHHPGLASIASRSFFLSGQLLIGNVRVSSARKRQSSGFPANFLHRITSHQLVGEMFRRFSADGISD